MTSSGAALMGCVMTGLSNTRTSVRTMTRSSDLSGFQYVGRHTKRAGWPFFAAAQAVLLRTPATTSVRWSWHFSHSIPPLQLDTCTNSCKVSATHATHRESISSSATLSTKKPFLFLRATYRRSEASIHMMLMDSITRTFPFNSGSSNCSWPYPSRFPS